LYLPEIDRYLESLSKEEVKVKTNKVVIRQQSVSEYEAPR
jgi:hypothetical protein